MFTGIIQEVGTITSLDTRGDWIITISAPLTVKDLVIGASVACSGVCLTVINIFDTTFVVQVSRETLDKTCAKFWQNGTRLNLERALRMGDELGGHIVSGHVDGIAKVISRASENDSLRFVFEVPEAFAAFLAPKGSVSLDGISLTVNEVDGCRFGVNIIPHTQAATTMGLRQIGDLLNFEIDLIALYVSRMMQGQGKI